MEAQRKNFIDGAVENGVPTAADIFVQVEKFAGYGFNKSSTAPMHLSPIRQPISKRTIQ